LIKQYLQRFIFFYSTLEGTFIKFSTSLQIWVVFTLPKPIPKPRKLRFAPNCPTQNPIEDILLQGKTWVRRFCALIPSFTHLKWMEEVVYPKHCL